MLILSRKIGENVLIDQGTIQIKLLDVKGRYARIGFIAPAGTDIDREEIYIRKKQSRDLNKKAANHEVNN
ncbi:carbon storage regulator [Legionella longbeachae]|uniref:carbon storage regulator n=1 Tax=Legionella longbeachae TaxID=450 RepID=UPI0001BEBC9A|nr:carbon storage regulator [Legionella longbeachae]EEZ95956.1 Legionella vir region protein LvrC [Legionella longbeachae D-4968]